MTQHIISRMVSYEHLQTYEEAFKAASVDEPDGLLEDFLAEPEVQRQILRCLWKGLKEGVAWLVKKIIKTHNPTFH